MTECDVWPGARTTNGYGKRWYKGKTTTAHRAEWLERNGPIPDGLFVLHHCDNRPCREITHLFLGTNADNLNDMAQKHRSTFGERNSTAKLTREQAVEIRARHVAGISQRSLAREFGVSRANVYYIVNNMTWADEHWPCVPTEEEES